MTKSKYNFVDNPLPILCSARVRISEEKHEELKAAHNAIRKASAPASKPPVMSGSTLTVETNTAPPIDRYKEFGLSPVVVSDLVGTRDSISLPMARQLSKFLGVEVVTQAEVEKAFQGYLEYMWQ